MNHTMIDGFRGFRSRFDDLRLLFELLQELPVQLGLEPVMPPFILPYYDGVEAEDAGISAFVLLRGGHFTLHTFSYRECYFADVLAPATIDEVLLRTKLEAGLPCERTELRQVERGGGGAATLEGAQRGSDFGPHYMLDLAGYEGPVTLDGVFELLDGLPREVSMTPIMRPYVLSGRGVDRGRWVSGVTMIAESHIALHVDREEGRAWFDVFSCRFFDPDFVLPRLRRLLPARAAEEILTARGRGYCDLRAHRGVHARNASAWLAVGEPSASDDDLATTPPRAR